MIVEKRAFVWGSLVVIVVLYRFYMAVSGIDRTNHLYVGVSFLNAVSMPVQKTRSLTLYMFGALSCSVVCFFDINALVAVSFGVDLFTRGAGSRPSCCAGMRRQSTRRMSAWFRADILY
jgi:hypothetical protein